jgi:hypothetical protein
MHLLKSSSPAHVFTTEDRRKAAAVTNAIRREKRALFEQLRTTREMEQMLARDAERRQRRAEKLFMLGMAGVVAQRFAN